MAKFIEIHAKGNPNLVNLDHVEHVMKRKDGRCEIYLSALYQDDAEQPYMKPDETYEQIRKMIGAAQGGIPNCCAKMDGDVDG